MLDINAVLGVIGAALGIFVAWYGIRRSFKSDKVSEDTGIASGQSQGIAQAFEGLRKTIEGMGLYITILENDNRISKEEIARLIKKRDELQRELNRMYRKYGENGLA